MKVLPLKYKPIVSVKTESSIYLCVDKFSVYHLCSIKTLLFIAPSKYADLYFFCLLRIPFIVFALNSVTLHEIRNLCSYNLLLLSTSSIAAQLSNVYACIFRTKFFHINFPYIILHSQLFVLFWGFWFNRTIWRIVIIVFAKLSIIRFILRTKTIHIHLFNTVSLLSLQLKPFSNVWLHLTICYYNAFLLFYCFLCSVNRFLFPEPILFTQLFTLFHRCL